MGAPFLLLAVSYMHGHGDTLLHWHDEGRGMESGEKWVEIATKKKKIVKWNKVRKKVREQ